MSDVYGEGHGSAHDWKYCWSCSSSKTSYYQCARCGHKFAHAYDSVPDIFQAMKQQSVPAECWSIGMELSKNGGRINDRL